MNDSKVKADFICFFIDTAKAKLEHKVNVIKLIFYTVPEIRQAWKEFRTAPDFSLDDAVSRNQGLQLQEYKFLHFIESDQFSTEQMWRVIEAADQITEEVNSAYAYTPEELTSIERLGETKNLKHPGSKITQEDIEFILKSNRQ